MDSIVDTVKDLTNVCQQILLAAILKQELPLSEKPCLEQNSTPLAMLDRQIKQMLFGYKTGGNCPLIPHSSLCFRTRSSSQ